MSIYTCIYIGHNNKKDPNLTYFIHLYAANSEEEAIGKVFTQGQALLPGYSVAFCNAYKESTSTLISILDLPLYLCIYIGHNNNKDPNITFSIGVHVAYSKEEALEKILTQGIRENPGYTTVTCDAFKVDKEYIKNTLL